MSYLVIFTGKNRRSRTNTRNGQNGEMKEKSKGNSMRKARPTNNAITPDNGFPGLGAAFLVEPTTGVLPPWGVIEISIISFNDTPGRYTDKLELTFTGGIFFRRTLPGGHVGRKGGRGRNGG